MCEIKVKYLKDVLPIKYIKEGDWIDLRSGIDIDLRKGDFFVIPLGVAMELPKGYEAIVAPRSSTFKNFGVIMTNSIGVIDESYCGDNDEWGFPALAIRTTHIAKNDRICQFRIVKHQPEILIKPVSHLSSNSRGGFGSTGIK